MYVCMYVCTACWVDWGGGRWFNRIATAPSLLSTVSVQQFCLALLILLVANSNQPPASDAIVRDSVYVCDVVSA